MSTLQNNSKFKIKHSKLSHRFAFSKMDMEFFEIMGRLK